MRQSNLVRRRLEAIADDVDQAGREVFYALNFVSYDNPGRANLVLALNLLGIHSPADVGLSDGVLRKVK